jgi:small conductance mechanosensitive channel
MGLIDAISSALEPVSTSLGIAIVLVLIGLILGRLLGKLMKRILSEIGVNSLIKSVTGLSTRFDSIVGGIVRFATYYIFAIWALDEIGLGSIVLSTLGAGIVVLFVLALLLGIKDFVPNAFAGMFLSIKKIVSPGDMVEGDKFSGKVIDVDLVETLVETKSGDIIYVPNSLFIKKGVLKIRH